MTAPVEAGDRFRQMVREAIAEGIAEGIERAGYSRPKPKLELLSGGRALPAGRRGRSFHVSGPAAVSILDTRTDTTVSATIGTMVPGNEAQARELPR